MGREVDPSDIGKHPELIKSKSEMIFFLVNQSTKLIEKKKLFYRSTNGNDQN